MLGDELWELFFSLVIVVKDFEAVDKEEEEEEEERLCEALSERVEFGAVVGACFVLPQALRRSGMMNGKLGHRLGILISR